MSNDQIAVHNPRAKPATYVEPNALDRFENPGLPPHRPRRSDVDEAAAKRAERQVTTMFGLSMLGTIGFLVAYFAVDPELRGSILLVGEMNLYHAILGLTMAVSLLDRAATDSRPTGQSAETQPPLRPLAPKPTCSASRTRTRASGRSPSR